MYVNFTNTQRQLLRLLNITEKYWFVEYKFGVFSINHAWKELFALLRVLFYIMCDESTQVIHSHRSFI